ITRLLMSYLMPWAFGFFFQAEDGIRDRNVTGVQTCALPIWLLKVDYSPATKAVEISESFGGELPGDLVSLYSGDGLSHHGGLFTSGVHTTVRQSWPSYTRGPGTKKPHFVDVTTMHEPDDTVDREDLGDAQRRWAQKLCDLTKTGVGSHMLV